MFRSYISARTPKAGCQVCSVGALITTQTHHRRCHLTTASLGPLECVILCYPGILSQRRPF